MILLCIVACHVILFAVIIISLISGRCICCSGISLCRFCCSDVVRATRATGTTGIIGIIARRAITIIRIIGIRRCICRTKRIGTGRIICIWNGFCRRCGGTWTISSGNGLSYVDCCGRCCSSGSRCRTRRCFCDNQRICCTVCRTTHMNRTDHQKS